MNYRLTDVTGLPKSDNALLTIVHPQSAVDIVSSILSPYTSARDPIENLDPRQRPDELLEQLATGEQVLFDPSGASPGIFSHRRAEAETVIANLPSRLTKALGERWDGTSSVGGAPGLIKGDSLTQAPEPAYQPPSTSANNTPGPGQRILELIYRWPDGTPVTGAAYWVEGVSRSGGGKLDRSGYARVTGLNDPVVNVRFGEPAPAGELDILRRQLQAGLDGIIARESREAAKLEASTENLPLTFNAGIHFANGFMGLWNSAAGLISSSLAIANLSHIGYYNRALYSAWTATRDGSEQAWTETFKQQFDEANKRAVVEALGFDPDDVTRDQLAEAYEITTLVLSDPESKAMLGRFAVDFAQAQDSTELSYFAGGLVFEAVLAILLSGAAAASATAAAPRYLPRLAPLGEALRGLAARLKLTYQTRYHYNVETGTVCESTCRPRPESPELQPRDIRTRRLNATTFDDARAALAASRRRLIKRGGFTPKYTQEELVQLTTQGLENDRFIVRLVESHHMDGYQQPEGSMKGTLGRPNPDNGEVRFWSTTLDQVEPSDTCPRLIAQQMGVEYNPKATYKLAIIDKDVAAQKAGAKTMIPTFENLKGYIRDNLEGYANRDESLDQVMTPDYQAKYEKLVEGMGDAEWESPKARSQFLMDQDLDADQIKAFETRFNIQDETGANQYFLGNGLTKHTELSKDGDAVFGAVETFTVEKNPQTFGAMTNGGKGGPTAYVELVDLTPIDFGE